MIKLMQKFILTTSLLLFVFLIIAGVSSASFDNVNGTTESIQSAIDNDDTIIILDGSSGSFDNLSTIYVNKSGVKISGTNNAVINRNSSIVGNLILFNITANNVIIENLTINTYYNSIWSNSSGLTITNNKINTTNTAINIENDVLIENIIVENNNIISGRDGVYLYSVFGSVFNNTISSNNITTTSSGHGVYLSSASANDNNIISANNIIVIDGEGVFLASSSGISSNNISSNNIRSSISGIYLASSSTISNNTISGNSITSGGDGAFLFSTSGAINNNSISGNNITSGGDGVYSFSSDAINNTIFGNNISSSGNGVSLFSSLGVIANFSVFSNNIFSNGTAIQIDGVSNGLIISYNRILTNGSFIVLNQIGINNTVFSNWFGNNTPDLSKVVNVTMSNWVVTNLTTLSNNVLVGDKAQFKYIIGLNDGSVLADAMNLPYFTFSVDGVEYDARRNHTLSMVYNETGDKVFGFYVDNQWLETSVNIIPTPTPTPTPTPVPTPTPNDNNDTNKTNNNPTAVAVMKKTGMPIISILLVLLGSLGLIVRKK